MSATGDNTYTPKSPDLSSLYMGSEAHSSSRLNRYAFPSSGTSTSPGAYHLQPPAQTQVQPQVQPPLETGSHNFSQPQLHYQYQYQSHPSHHYNNNHRATNGSAATATITNYNAYHSPPQQQQHPQHPQHPQFAPYNNNNSPQHSLPPYPHQSGAQYYHQAPPRHQQPQYLPPHQPGYQSQATPSSYYSSYTDSPTSNSYLPTSQPLQQQHTHQQQQQQQQEPQQPPQPPQQQQTLVFNQPTTPDTHNPMPRGKAAAQAAKEPDVMESPVRTKFPTARIKRIMQADEEVGKVAQQTPIAVGKALELFMVQLVHKSAEVAKDKNSKRITAPMLKQAIDSTNEWDFLREIVAKVAEEKEGARSGGRTKAESESEDDADAGEVRKKGRGGRKKKLVA
ncbi:hypothetical protein F5B18DRAFT_67738 [Nemania serpens]|nr:hypothetical protein F5B18DRAFT_67738 [Nemania serpens]